MVSEKTLPIYSGEKSIELYGNQSTTPLQRLGENGYTAIGGGFFKRNGFKLLKTSDREMITIALSEYLIGVITEQENPNPPTEDGTDPVQFVPKGVLSIFNTFGQEINSDLITEINFEDFKTLRRLTYYNREGYVFSMSGGIYTFNNIENNFKYLLNIETKTILKIDNSINNNVSLPSLTISDSTNIFEIREGVTNSLVIDSYEHIFFHKLNKNSSPPREVFDIRIYMKVDFPNPPGDKKVKKWEEDITNATKDAEVINPDIKYIRVEVKTYYKRSVNDWTVIFTPLGFLYEDTVTGDIPQNFTLSAFFLNRLFVLDGDFLYFSNLEDPYTFGTGSVEITDQSVLNKKEGGKLKLSSFINFEGYATNMLSFGRYVLITTSNHTYVISVNVDTPFGFRIDILSDEGAINKGLIFSGSEVYKLSKRGISKLLNHLNYDTIQEIDCLLYGHHIYLQHHIGLSILRRNKERYLVSLRSDGIVFIHTLLQSNISSEIAYNIDTSRWNSYNFDVIAISDPFNSGVGIIKSPHITGGMKYVAFSVDMFNFRNDNQRTYSFYDFRNKTSYNFLDFGVCRSYDSLVFRDYTDYIYHSDTKMLHVYDSSFLDDTLVGKKFLFNKGYILTLKEIINNENDTYLTFENDLESETFDNIVENDGVLILRGLIYETVLSEDISRLKSLYGENDKLTKELRMVYVKNGVLYNKPFDLYNTLLPPESKDEPHNISSLKTIYYAIGIPFHCRLSLNYTTYPIENNTLSMSYLRTVGTQELYLSSRIHEYEMKSLYKQDLYIRQISNKIYMPNSMSNERDLLDVKIESETGMFMGILGITYKFTE